MYKIYGTYCAALTPVNKDFSINNKLYLDHCNNLLSQGLDGLGIFGSTGESNSFTIDEKINAINFLLDNKIDPNKLIIGSGLCSIRDSVFLTKTAAQLKVKAVLVLPAFFYKNVSNDCVVEFYQRIVENVGDNNLKYIKSMFPLLKINVRGNVIYIDGDKKEASEVLRILDEMVVMSANKEVIEQADVELLSKINTETKRNGKKISSVEIIDNKCKNIKEVLVNRFYIFIPSIIIAFYIIFNPISLENHEIMKNYLYYYLIMKWVENSMHHSLILHIH